jgi:hypothetical protein
VPFSDAQAAKTPAANISLPLSQGADIDVLLDAFYGGTGSSGTRRILMGRDNLWSEVIKNGANSAWAEVISWTTKATKEIKAVKPTETAKATAISTSTTMATSQLRGLKGWNVLNTLMDSMDPFGLSKLLWDNGIGGEALNTAFGMSKRLWDMIFGKIAPLMQLSGCNIISAMTTEINTFLAKSPMCISPSPSCSGSHLNNGEITTVHEKVGLFKAGLARCLRISNTV